MIYVDADACPVEKEIINIANKHHTTVYFVKSFAHFSSKNDSSFIQTIYTEKGADAVDYKIASLAQNRDIIVTHDYGLASLCLSKHCTVIHPKGFLYTEKNIDQLLHIRHINAIARRAGKRTKGPKAFTEHDRKQFKTLLERIISKQRS